LFQTIWITAFNFGHQARTNFAPDFSGKLLRKYNDSRFSKLWVYKRWCAHDTRDFLKDDLVWKDKKTNSCITIENSPTFYGGQPLLSTDSCKKSLPFICEVWKLHYRSAEFEFFQNRFVLVTILTRMLLESAKRSLICQKVKILLLI